MKRAIGHAGLAVLMAVALSSGAFAASASLDLALSGDIVQQRKDVDEVARPLPPGGPATPSPYCSPGSPVCP